MANFRKKYKHYVQVYEVQKVSDSFGGFTENLVLVGSFFANIVSSNGTQVLANGVQVKAYATQFQIRYSPLLDGKDDLRISYNGVNYRVNSNTDETANNREFTFIATK